MAPQHVPLCKTPRVAYANPLECLCWHGWDTDDTCNARRWIARRELVSRRACRAREHPERECRSFYEGAAWSELGAAAFPNRERHAA